MTAEVCARFDTAEKFEITMNDPAASLRRKITSAGKLESVKAMSAPSIGQYESAALSLDDYLSDGATGFGRVFPARANRTVSFDCEPRKPSLL